MGLLRNRALFDELELDIVDLYPRVMSQMDKEYEKMSESSEGYPHISFPEFKKIAERYFILGQASRSCAVTYKQSDLDRKMKNWWDIEVNFGLIKDFTEMTYEEYQHHCKAFFIFGKYGCNI